MLVSHVVAQILTIFFIFLGAVLLPLASRFRAKRGRPVALPTYVQPPASLELTGQRRAQRERMGRLIIDGDQARLVGSGFHLVTPVAMWRAATVRRAVEHDAQAVGPITQARMYDEQGGAWLVGVPDNWTDALTRRTRVRPLRRWTRWRLAGPRWVGLVVGMLLVIPVPFHALWWTGHDAKATVVAVAENKGQPSCEVRWTDDSGEHTAFDNGCPAESSEPGEERRVRVLGPPMGDKLMTTVTLVMVTLLTVLPSMILGLVGRIVGWSRLRRTPIRLVGTGYRPMPPALDLSTLSSQELWERLATAEGWFEEPATAPPSPRSRVLGQMVGHRGWLLGLLLVLVGLLNDGPWRLAAVAGALVWLVVVARAVSTGRRMSTAPSSFSTSEWPYLLVRTPKNTWTMLLTDRGEPAWQLNLGRPEHPPITGIAQVRGDIRQGSRVAVTVSGQVWQPESTLQQVSQAELRVMREGVLHLLTRAERQRS